ncbi:MAG TPA: type II CAAX endopeptidase family protein [Pseudonocardiaceae bacterium]|nr:type II CAAX endopeptidase family protein [Pseudonocardiaceae bacterium]
MFYVSGMDIMSDSRISGMLLSQDHRLRLAWRIVLAWLGFFGCLLVVGGAVHTVTSWLPEVTSNAAASVGIAASALGLVWLLRRHIDRRPWSGIALTLHRAAIPHLLAGIVLAGVVSVAAAAATVQLGLADWRWSAETTNDGGLAITIILIALSTVLVQAFPEELVFRGYMYANLGETLPLWATVVSSSLIFGSMHVFSDQGATTAGQHATYAVAATGFGLMLAACRMVSGMLWLGIGFHCGFDVCNNRLTIVHHGAFIPAWLIVLVVLILGAAFTIAIRQWRAPADWRAIPGDTWRCAGRRGHR